MLNISNLSIKIGEKEILHDVCLNIPKGEVHALFGPNGSGKSVLIRSILGYPEYKVNQGKIIFNNQNLLSLTIDQRVNLGLGVCEQRPPTIKGVKLRNLIEDMCSTHSRKKNAKKMIKEFNIRNFLDRNINDGLSGGEIKYSELFLLLISCPTFLLLDEPDSGVDPEHIKMVSKMINTILKKKTDITDNNDPLHCNSGLIVTHSAAILDFIHIDKAHLMVDGKILCSGNPEIMMDQIRSFGYEYCIKCQKLQRKMWNEWD